jgi:hypothetical protein
MPGLICDVCGLPVVPFGGEDICLDPEHREGYEDGVADPYVDDDCEDDNAP